MNEIPLSEPLEKRGFRPVETALVGDWASNEQWSIQIRTLWRGVGERRHLARVYDAPADALEVPSVELLHSAESEDQVRATELALEGAERHGDRDD